MLCEINIAKRVNLFTYLYLYIKYLYNKYSKISQNQLL